MFYNKRWVFYLFLYVMIVGLFFLAQSQSILSGILQNFFFTTIFSFVIILILCSVAAFVVTVLAQYVCLVWCRIKKLTTKKLFSKTMWYLFTAFCYISVLLIFLKLVEY